MYKNGIKHNIYLHYMVHLIQIQNLSNLVVAVLVSSLVSFVECFLFLFVPWICHWCASWMNTAFVPYTSQYAHAMQYLNVRTQIRRESRDSEKSILVPGTGKSHQNTSAGKFDPERAVWNCLVLALFNDVIVYDVTTNTTTLPATSPPLSMALDVDTLNKFI